MNAWTCLELLQQISTFCYFFKERLWQILSFKFLNQVETEEFSFTLYLAKVNESLHGFSTHIKYDRSVTKVHKQAFSSFWNKLK